MNKELLHQRAKEYVAKISTPSAEMLETMHERAQRVVYYQSWTAERLRAMSESDLLEYLSKLWAMLIWGNKQYVVDKMLAGQAWRWCERKSLTCSGVKCPSQHAGTVFVPASRAWVVQ